MESILQSIKKLLGIQNEYKIFDPDVIMHINTTFGILYQLGIGPKDGYMITDETSTWSEFYTSVPMSMIQTYVYIQVRILFDPPTSNILMESYKQKKDELEWRILSENEKDYVYPEINSKGGE